MEERKESTQLCRATSLRVMQETKILADSDEVLRVHLALFRGWIGRFESTGMERVSCGTRTW